MLRQERGSCSAKGRSPIGTVRGLLAGWWRLSAGLSVLDPPAVWAPPLSSQVPLPPPLACSDSTQMFFSAHTSSCLLHHSSWNWGTEHLCFSLVFRETIFITNVPSFLRVCVENILSESCVTTFKLLTENVSEESTPTPLGTVQNWDRSSHGVRGQAYLAMGF